MGNKKSNDTVQLNEFIAFSFFWIPILQILLTSIGYWLVRGKVRLMIMLLAVLGWGFTGHSASPTYGGYLGFSLDVMHLFAAAIWIGGITALLIMAPKNETEDLLRKIGSVYSKWALISVIVLAITGTWMTIKYVPLFSLESFYKSSWGKMILVKIVLLIEIMAIGFWQRKYLTNIAITSLRFIRNLRIELFIGFIVLFAAAVLVDLPPREAEQGLVPKWIVVNGIKASVSITPLMTGTNDVAIQFDHQDFKKVNVVVSMPPTERKEDTAFSLGNGQYRLTGNVLHSPSTMYMEVHAEQENGDIITFPFEIRVPGVVAH